LEEINKWGIDEVCNFLKNTNLGKFVEIFKKKKITGKFLLKISNDNIKNLTEEFTEQIEIVEEIEILKKLSIKELKKIQLQNTITQEKSDNDNFKINKK
jgi:nitrogen regulatory protein PII-like uncharacterized protein